MFERLADKKILITGGTGFIGRHLTETLAAQGVAPFVLTRKRRLIFENAAVNLIEADLADSKLIENLLFDLRPEIIVHLAGCVYRNDDQPEAFERTNYQATARLLGAAGRIGVEKIVITGTADEYGFQTSPQTESMAAMPVSDYARSKNKAVEYALSRHRNGALPVTIFRPFTVYGIGQPARMFIAQAIESALAGKSFEMSEGLQKRDLLFVADFVNAIIKSLTIGGIEGEIYNIGGGQSFPLRDVAKKIWRIAGADEKLLRIGARQTNRNELHDTEADIGKIKRALNWQPTFSLEEGLNLTIEKAKRDLR